MGHITTTSHASIAEARSARSSLSDSLVFRIAVGLLAAFVTLDAARAADLTSLPAYQPSTEVRGVIRNFGSPLGGVLKVWEEGFRKFHPHVRFQDDLPSSDAYLSGLMAGVADTATGGREAMVAEYLAFYEVFGTDLVEIPVATGAAEVKGRTYALAIFVHKDNPITKLTIEQLDGIFGAERLGGYEGYRLTKVAARGPDKDIRTWGELGLKGEWANKPINTYGYSWTGMTNFFQRVVFRGGEKWNPNYRGYVETGTKMAPDASLGIKQMLADLSNDKYGIGWTGVPQAKGFDQLRIVALANDVKGPYVLPSKQTVQDRSYPLARFIYIAIRQGAGQQADPRVKEFLRYILSREGQQDVVTHGIYEPLTAQLIAEARGKLQ